MRVDYEIMKVLKQKAKKRNVSINVMANQIFREYVDWHMQAVAGGFIYFKKSLLAALADKVDEKDIVQMISEHAENEEKQTLYMLRRKCDIDAALDIFHNWLRMSGFQYNDDVDAENSIYSFIIQLGMNKKSSMLIGELFRKVFENLGAVRVEYETTPAMIILRIVLGSQKNQYHF